MYLQRIIIQQPLIKSFFYSSDRCSDHIFVRDLKSALQMVLTVVCFINFWGVLEASCRVLLLSTVLSVLRLEVKLASRLTAVYDALKRKNNRFILSRLNSSGTILQIPKTSTLYIRNSLHADYQPIRQQRASEPVQEASPTPCYAE